MRIWILGIAVGISAVACTPNKSSGEDHPAPSATAATSAPVVASVAPTAPAAPVQTVEIQMANVGNTMTFDKTKLTVPTGAKVHLVLKNVATEKTLQHNWALVLPGKEAEVAAEGLAKAQTSGYVVPGPNILAYTPLAAPGSTTEVTFTAPAPGNYPYICTFPGHYIMMKGVLTVTP